MKSPILGLLGFALIGVGGYAMAQSLVGTTTHPTGIDGLVVDGTTYNVTFSTTTYQSPFTEGTAASIAAANAMATALTSLGVTQLAGVSPAPACPPMSNICQFNSQLFVAVDNAAGPNDAATCSDAEIPAAPCSQHSWTSGFTRDTSGNSFEQLGGLGPLSFGGTVFGFGYAANFKAAGVPDPGTLSLLALGLVGTGFARLIRRTTACAVRH
jgi:hypothetical protein